MDKGKIYVGSELFINDQDTPEQITRWVRQMQEARFHIIRLFVLWQQVEPQEGCWNFSQYDAVFSAAEAHHMQVVPTLMSVNPPKWMAKYDLYAGQGDMDNPRYWDFADKYIQAVVSRYCQSPALHSWILWNEPTRTIRPGPYSTPAYARYLMAHCPSESVQLPMEAAGEKALAGDIYAAKNRASDIQWIRFCVDDMRRQLLHIRDAVKEIDPQHPVHVNPHMTGYNHMPDGQSPWMEGRIVDFMGSSIHPVWHSTRFLPERVDQSVAYFCDLMRSCTRDKDRYFWASELQGGPTIFSGNFPSCPSPSDIRHWMWEIVGAGSKGIVFWCFNTRDEGLEAGEWGMLNQNGKPSVRLQAATAVCRELEAYRQELEQAHSPKPDVYILYSESSMLVAWTQADAPWSPIRSDAVEEPRNKNFVLDALVGCYCMCSDLGLEVAFVDEEMLCSGSLDPEVPLVIPNVFAADGALWKAVEEYMRRGGLVIADGIPGFKTPQGRIARKEKPLVDRLLGTLEDVEGYPGEFPLFRDSLGLCMGWHMKCTFENPQTVLEQDACGNPVVIQTRCGPGRSLRIGTSFFQRYLSQPAEAQRCRFQKWTGLASHAPISPESREPSLRIRYLEVPDGVVLILLNRGPARECTLKAAYKGCLQDGEGRLLASLTPGDTCSCPLEAEEVRVLKFRFP